MSTRQEGKRSTEQGSELGTDLLNFLLSLVGLGATVELHGVTITAEKVVITRIEGSGSESGEKGKGREERSRS
ncbi:MAG: hypothetical protein DRJ40_03065 [Thermoprotei archaeon]|nr:MAG: hypothetical protein DRJ40_03065 [Thermoprotei archaeon]